jgi:hypothetical protein
MADTIPTDELVVTASTDVKASTFSVSKFRSEIVNNGVLPQNRFIVIFTIPKILNAGKPNTEYLSMRCENASIPGVNFFTSQTVRYGYGQIERRPYLPSFNPMTLSFIVDQKSTIIAYFRDWTNGIVNHDISSGIYGTGNAALQPNEMVAMPYQLNYKDDYICKQMQIYVYDYQNKKQIKVTLYDAYPLSTNDVNLSWGDTETMKYNVTMQYTNMTMEVVSVPVTLPQAQTIPLNNDAALEDIINIKNVVPTNPFVSQNMQL